MIAVPVSTFLVQLPAAGQPSKPLLIQQQPAIPPEDLDALLRAEFLRGFQSGRQEAEEAFTAERTTFVEESAAIAAARARETATALAARLDSSFADLGSSLSEAVGRLLQPFIENSIKAEAFADLLAQLREILASDAVFTCVIQAPEDYRPAFMELLANKPYRTEFRAAQAPEISVRVDELVMETRVAEWISAIEAVR